MSLPQIGAQEPRIRVHPPLDSWDSLYTDGDDACALAESFGLIADPWQRYILCDWLRRDDNDMIAVSECGLAVPRQNGKNEVLLMRELYGLCIMGEKILHTAHRVDTARKSFLRLVTFFDNPEFDELRELVVSIRKTNGQESITLVNGGIIEFSSRVNGGGRGSTYDLIIFDEAQEITADHLEAMLPTISASSSGNRQLLYTGTPPSPVSPGESFRRIRRGALDGSNKDICWHEWSIEKLGDVADKSLWYATNPAMGIRLSESFTETEFNTFDREGFARERLGWWTTETSINAVFNRDMWDAVTCEPCEVPGLTDDEKLAYGVKFAPDGVSYSLGVAVKGKGERVLFELIQSGLCVSGINSIAKWLLERKSKCSMLAIDGKMNTSALVQRLVEGGFPKRGLRVMNSHDASSASDMFFNAVTEREVIHARAGALDDSAFAAVKRPIGKDGAWGFGDGVVPCTPLESVAIAYWAVSTTKRRAGRKSRLL